MATSRQPLSRPPFNTPITTTGEMAPFEVGSGTIARATSVVFNCEERWGERGSPWRQFYSQAAAMPGKRLIIWNTERGFAPKHIFFRTADTGRILAMDNGPFRLQFWEGSRLNLDPKFRPDVIMSMIHELLLLRNFHDFGAADIPVVLCDLNQAEIKQAMDYWVWLSKKGNATHPKRKKKFNSIYDTCRKNGRYPCFLQLDLTVRKVLSIRGNNGFVPPFIIIWSTNTREDRLYKAQILFTRECAVPPQTLMQSWPNTCGAPKCTEPDCELIAMPRGGKDKTWVLSTDGGLVSDTNNEGKKIQGERYCNHWPCKEKRAPGGLKFKECSKCKQVVYCCPEHQRFDWPIHRDICGSSSRADIESQKPMGAISADGSISRFSSGYELFDRMA